jgi:hypothetical protein
MMRCAVPFRCLGALGWPATDPPGSARFGPFTFFFFLFFSGKVYSFPRSVCMQLEINSNENVNCIKTIQYEI